jgi:site-specific recombinase XerD
LLSQPYFQLYQDLRLVGIGCVGVMASDSGGFNFRIHDLRHTHASIAINNGASLYEVQHLLGHSQTKTTSRYAHLADDTLRRVSDGVSSAIGKAIV